MTDRENLNAICPRCGHHVTRVIPPSGQINTRPARIECAKCGRFVGWSAPAKIIPETKAADAPIPPPIPPGQPLADTAAAEHARASAPPDLWLYVSRRLDLEWFPNHPFYASPTIALRSPDAFPDGPFTTYYRLTPRVFVWLEAAGMSMEQMVLAGSVSRQQLAEYLRLMETVTEFATTHLDPRELADARRAARERVPTLPDHEWPEGKGRAA